MNYAAKSNSLGAHDFAQAIPTYRLDAISKMVDEVRDIILDANSSAAHSADRLLGSEPEAAEMCSLSEPHEAGAIAEIERQLRSLNTMAHRLRQTCERLSRI